MRRVIVLFLMCIAANATPSALYLLGDSTSVHLYESTLLPLCDGQPDPLETRAFETVYQHKLHGVLCRPGFLFTRIGFLNHWGVANSTYHGAWGSHRSAGDTENSVQNIFDAVAEFQKRSVSEERVVFIFLSNIWDAKRYLDNFQSTHSPAQFRNEFATNYEFVVKSIASTLRPGKDVLLLQTCHLAKDINLVTPMAWINEIVRDTAKRVSVTLFDEAKLLEPDCWDYNQPTPGFGCVREHLADPIHQNTRSDHLIMTALTYYLRNVAYEYLI